MIPSCIIDSISFIALASFSSESTTEIMTGRSCENGSRPLLCVWPFTPYPRMPRYTVAPGNIHQAQTLDDRFIKRFALPLVRLAHIDPHQPGRASHFRMRPFRRRWAFLVGDFDNLGVLDLNHAVGHHVVEGGHELIDFLGGFDELDANRQVLGEHLDFGCVHHLVGAETGHRARGGSAGHPFVKQERQNGVAQGTKVVLRVLIDENRDLLCRALLEHTNSSRSR